MTAAPTIILPVRDFSGMTRLGAVLDATERETLVRQLCERARLAIAGANLRCVVVSSSRDVIEWATSNALEHTPDAGRGLSEAAATAAQSLDGAPWIVLHADLPLVTSTSLLEITELASRRTVLVPSHDGGTNVVAARGHFPFAYGAGSFHRHFAAAPRAIVAANAELSIDIDTPAQLTALPSSLRVGMVEQ